MFKPKPVILTALVAAIAACGQANESNDTESTPPSNATASSVSDPFAEPEKTMSQAMMAAAGVDAGDTWVRMMIAHHQGAIDMSRAALQQDVSAGAAKMAQDAIDKQTKEVADLRKLIRSGTPEPKTIDVYHPAMKQMEDAMQRAKGADVSETFMRKMLAHHKGGVALADVALKNGVTGDLRAQVQKTREGQQKDADMTESMLGGQSPEKRMGNSAEATDEHEAHDMNAM